MGNEQPGEDALVRPLSSVKFSKELGPPLEQNDFSWSNIMKVQYSRRRAISSRRGRFGVNSSHQPYKSP